MTHNGHGIVSKRSSYGVDETVRRFESVLNARGIMLFAAVDHSGEAEKVGLKLRPTKLLIFGNPKAGTPLMQASPLLAIDLPLKALIWEDDDRGIWVSYHDPLDLKERYAIPPDLLKNIAVIAALVDQALMIDQTFK